MENDINNSIKSVEDSSFNETLGFKNKYAQEIIGRVWERLAKEGIENADSLIGTRETIENKDFEKFWKNVKKEDIEKLISYYKEERKQSLIDFEKFKGEFDPLTGKFSSDDTSFFDKKIADLEKIFATIT